MKDIIRKYAIQNAVKYNGKANLNAVIGKVFSEHKADRSIIKDIESIVNEVNSLSVEEQKKQLEKYDIKEKDKSEERKLPELNDVKGKVVMRLAPYPSGPLHIGNARPYILNDEYVKKYKGKLILVLDDTIGSEEKAISPEAYELIPKGLKWLKIKYHWRKFYKSDRLKLYYAYAETLIKKDKAYVCFCDSETLRNNRKNQKECECRKKSVNENMENWKKMFTMKEGEAALRIKTSMEDKNPAFRDRVIFRISDRPHPRTKNKYRVWPLLDFSWAIDDYLLGITHIIRGKELMIESEMERYIWKIFNWKQPEIIHTGLLQIEGIKLSKSKSKKEVEQGIYSGWDDPRTWSLQSLKRRGFKPEAIRFFCLSFGVNQNEITVPVESLYSENRKLIDKEANRYFFIVNPTKIKIENNVNETEVDLHPEFPKRGKRKFKIGNEFYVEDKLEKNKNYRFMHLFNFKDDKFTSKEHDPNLKAKIIHWLPVDDELVNVEVVMDDGSVIKGFGEKGLRKVKEDEVIQFERKFFARCDKKEKNRMVFWFTHR